MNTPNVYLEHANITVHNLKAAVKFFQTAFPHFKIRGGGHNLRSWIHLGDDTTYLALNEAIDQQPKPKGDYDSVGINHLGFVVENVEIVAKNLQAGGYQRDYPKQVEKHRIRDYFADEDGNQYEFVQYLSDVIEERNSFE